MTLESTVEIFGTMHRFVLLGSISGIQLAVRAQACAKPFWIGLLLPPARKRCSSPNANIKKSYSGLSTRTPFMLHVRNGPGIGSRLGSLTARTGLQPSDVNVALKDMNRFKR